MQEREWDGTTMLYSKNLNQFFDSTELEGFGEEEGRDLQLIICEPLPLRTVDEDYWDLPDGVDLPPSVKEALELLNQTLRNAPPLEWVPGRFRPKVT